MAPVPKKKTTRSKTGIRRYSVTHRLKLPSLVTCKNCKKLKPMGVACPSCGFYK